MRCHCGYEAPKLNEDVIWSNHTAGEHNAYVLGASDKLLEITSKFNLTPKSPPDTSDTSDTSDSQ